MARIHSKNTGPELKVRTTVHAAGFRYRLHKRTLPGSPDLVFARFSIAVFINGCFWHGHNCKDGARPASNTEYWNGKIDRTIARDKRNAAALRRKGWKVVVIWTCRLENGVRRLLKLLQADLRFQSEHTFAYNPLIM